MFNLDYALQICDWDTEDHKQGVNYHTNLLGNFTDFIT